MCDRLGLTELLLPLPMKMAGGCGRRDSGAAGAGSGRGNGLQAGGMRLRTLTGQEAEEMIAAASAAAAAAGGVGGGVAGGAALRRRKVEAAVDPASTYRAGAGAAAGAGAGAGAGSIESAVKEAGAAPDAPLPLSAVVNGYRVLLDESGFPVVGRPLRRPPRGWDARLVPQPTVSGGMDAVACFAFALLCFALFVQPLCAMSDE